MSEKLIYHFNLFLKIGLSSYLWAAAILVILHMAYCHKIGNTPMCPKHSKAQ